MANDLELIKELKKKTGKKIPRRDFDEIMSSAKPGFAADDQGRVTALNLDKIKIETIPAALPRFQHLEVLSLYDNRISDVAPLSGLNNLTVLSLESNLISDVSPLSGLNNLNELILNSNKISDVAPLYGLNNLNALSLESNLISDVGPLSGLNNLNELILNSNHISDVAPLSGLTNLNELILNSNHISDVGPLSGLTNLAGLCVSNNRISNVGPLSGLNNMARVDLRYNKISNLRPLTGLSNLKSLDLRNNKIAILPPQILNLDMAFDVEDYSGNGYKLFLKGNPLEQPPPEIIKQGKAAMRSYFRELEKEKKLPLREAKILLVGDGGAGKTSLAKCLLGRDFDANENQTHGINIDKWIVNEGEDEIKAHLWDFGGQEIMHATHQFFLSKRSLYVLVLDGRRDEKTEYWLKHIESFGGDSPVLVVLNKIDQNPGFNVNRSFLQQKYRNIKGFYRLSCAGQKGLKRFCAALQKALAKVELIHTTWPESWFEIKKELEHMSDHFINRRQYEAICRDADIKGKTSGNVLLEFLNDLGIVLHFKDFELQDTHVLEPEWVTGAVYKIINSPELAEKKGVLKLSMLDTILEKKDDSDFDYPPDQYRFIIGLMEKFELCYPLVKGKSVLVPDLLDVAEPGFDFEYTSALSFIVEYDFLPRSVMPRFIVNMYRDIEDDLQWRTGVVLTDRDFGAQALVRADNEAKRIYIYVTGKQKRDYFAALLLTLRRINGSFEKLETKELIPLPDNPKVTVLYKTLVKLEAKGVEEYITGESENEYKVKDLLGTITGEKAVTEKEIVKLLKKIATDVDTKESLTKKLNESFIFQPQILGVGINASKIIDNFIGMVTKKTGKKSKA